MWKTVAEKCGESLSNAALQALRKLSINESMSVDTIKNNIFSALNAIEPYTTNSRVLSSKLAVVAKYKLPIFKSWVIYFGATPFKTTHFLPDCSVLFKDQMDRYCHEEIPVCGCFVQKKTFVLAGRPILVYVYSFDEAESCSVIGRLHHALPTPKISSNPIKDEELHRSFFLGAGNTFFHFNKDATMTEYKSDGTIIMKWKKQTVTEKGNEDSRSQHLLDHLRDALVPKYKAIDVSKVEQVSKKKYKTFCYFTGGGDIKLSTENAQLVFMTEIDKEAEIECGDSPIKSEEIRETLGFELKASQTKTNEDVRLQLQANLYNIIVREYMYKIESMDASSLSSYLENVHMLSIYGISFGINRPVDVLKMSVDFNNRILHYEIKYEDISLMPKEGLIDGLIIALTDRLTKRSPSLDVSLGHGLLGE